MDRHHMENQLHSFWTGNLRKIIEKNRNDLTGNAVESS